MTGQPKSGRQNGPDQTNEVVPKIIVVCGPTASGKTDLGLRLALALDGEIIGADSLQVYRHFDVGSAKPTAEEQALVPHHLIDVRDPDETFNAALYKELADEAVAQIRERGRVPIVVGGTGLYLRILIRGIFEAPAPDEGLRVRLRAEADAYGIEALYKRLELVDPELANRVESHDRNRVMRGLEIFEQTGIPLSVHQRVHDYGDPSYEAFTIGIKRKRKELYQRIARRSEKMFEGGLLDEYSALRRRGYTSEIKPMQSLGYRQLGRVEAGEMTLDEALRDLIKKTKRYAKRQITWFRRTPNVRWLAPAAADDGRSSITEDQLERLVADIRRFLSNEPIVGDWVAEPP